MKKVMCLKPHKRNLVNSKKANTIARTRRIEPKVKEKAWARYLRAINMVVQTILPENVEPLNI
jgi:hypothetical protein